LSHVQRFDTCLTTSRLIFIFQIQGSHAVLLRHVTSAIKIASCSAGRESNRRTFACMTLTCFLTELDPLPVQSKLKVLTSSTGQAYICHTRVAPTSAAFAYPKYVLKKRSRPLADVKAVCNTQEPGSVSMNSGSHVVNSQNCATS
jgi:hypothetical protein